jgi:hypothetical protein
MDAELLGRGFMSISIYLYHIFSILRNFVRITFTSALSRQSISLVLTIHFTGKPYKYLLSILIWKTT